MTNIRMILSGCSKCRRFLIIPGLLLCTANATAQAIRAPSATIIPTSIESGGVSVRNEATDAGTSVQFSQLQEEISGLPVTPMLKLSTVRSVEAISGGTRSAKDAQVYRVTAPSVVRVLTNSGDGTGSLIGANGEILTNYHVVSGQSEVGILFKPAVEGVFPTREDLKLGRVIKFDEVVDLALIQAAEVPKGRTPIRLGESSDIAIGADVSAIGHPLDEAWTFTKGIISQYRTGYEWTAENTKHKADVIQTQTPINPGNSGGPLISDSGALIGVNSFRERDSQGINFSISIDEVRRFLSRQGNRLSGSDVAASTTKSCELKEISRFRNKKNNATVVAYDTKCTGKADANYIIPDSKTQAIMYTVDRNGDGRPDVIFFDLKRQKRWDISFWDDKFEGRWTLVGYHPDGKLTPTSFESYEKFQSRVAAR